MAEAVEEKPVIKDEVPGATTFADLFKDATDDEPAAEETPVDEKKPVVEEKKVEDKPAHEKNDEKPAATEGEEKTVKFNIGKPAEAAKTTDASADGTTDGSKPVEEKKPAAAPAVKLTREEQLKALGADDFVIDLLKFRESGGDVSKYIEAKGRDWSKVSDISLVTDKLKQENSFLEGDDLEIMIEEGLRKYGLHEDATEAEKKRGAVLLKVDGHKLRQEQIAEQSKFQIPAAKAVDNKEQGPSPQEVYANQLKSSPETKSLLQSKKVVMDGGKPGYKITLDIDQPEELVNLWTNPETYAKYMLDAEGKPNVAKQNLATLFMIDPQFVINSLIDQGREVEKQANVTTKQNIDKKATVIPSSDGKKSISKAFAEDGKDMKMGDL